MKFNAHTSVEFSTFPESGSRQWPPSSSRAFHCPTHEQTPDPVAGPPHTPTQPLASSSLPLSLWAYLSWTLHITVPFTTGISH